MPVCREEGSDEWQRVAHPVDLNRIVRSAPGSNTTKDGSSGVSNTPLNRILKSSSLFSTPGPTPIMIPS